MKKKYLNIDDIKQDFLRVYNIINKIPTKKEYAKFGKYSIYKFDSNWKSLLKEFFPYESRTNSLKISEEELIKDLRRVFDIIKSPPSKNKYLKYGKYSTVVYRNIKSWNQWMIDVFNINCGKSNKKNSDEDLIQNLLDLKKSLGRNPIKNDLNLKNGSKYSINSYKRAFGNFNNSIIAAGLLPNQIHKKYIKPNNEIIEEIKRIYFLLKFTPSLNDLEKYSNINFDWSIYKRKDYFKRMCNDANIPSNEKQKLTQQDIINSLKEWYNKHNKDTRCLEYWKIRKAKKVNEFPYSTYIILSKFDENKYPNWESIMQQIDPNYKTIDQFTKRAKFTGNDGRIYLSSIEKQSADILLNLKNDNKIKDYKYEEKVCKEKIWTCDFKIILNNNNEIWLEVDGMRNNRKDPYNSGLNQKINYYKNNDMNYKIISYTDVNIEKSIIKYIE